MKAESIQGVVIKVTENQCVLLCNDGTFKNVPRNKEEVPIIGERITYHYKSRSSILNFKTVAIISMAAILFLSILSFGLFQKNTDPLYIASIDINPSIEAQLDENLNVISLSPLNEDGEKIVDSIHYEDLDWYEVMETIVSTSISKGYLTEYEQGLISTTIVSLTNNGDSPSDDQLKQVIKKQLQEHHVVADVEVFHESKEFYEKSQLVDLSMNKYREYETLKESGLAKDIVEVKEKSVKQLQDMVTEARRGAQDQNGQGASKEEKETETETIPASEQKNNVPIDKRQQQEKEKTNMPQQKANSRSNGEENRDLPTQSREQSNPSSKHEQSNNEENKKQVTESGKKQQEPANDNRSQPKNNKATESREVERPEESKSKTEEKEEDEDEDDQVIDDPAGKPKSEGASKEPTPPKTDAENPSSKSQPHNSEAKPKT